MVAWIAFTLWAASFWFNALADAVGFAATIFFIVGLALIPSAINVFVMSALLMDQRPKRRALAKYPALSVLMYVRDHAQSIGETIESIRRSAPGGAGKATTSPCHSKPPFALFATSGLALATSGRAMPVRAW